MKTAQTKHFFKNTPLIYHILYAFFCNGCFSNPHFNSSLLNCLEGVFREAISAKVYLVFQPAPQNKSVSSIKTLNVQVFVC